MNRRNPGIDILRLLCAFLVVCIHIHFPGTIGEYVKAVARIAVPVFFICTGFYYPVCNEHCNIAKSIRKGYMRLFRILKMIVLSNGFYFLVMLAEHAAKGEMHSYIKRVFTFSMLKDVLLFNASPFCEPLWYLNAVLYCVGIVMILEKQGWRKALYVIAPVLFAGDMILGQYSVFVFGRYFPNVFTRNWLFFGLPNVAIGMMIKEYGIVNKVKKTILLPATVILIFGIVSEYTLLQKAGVTAEREHYVFAAVLGVVLFLLFAQGADASGRIELSLAHIGEKTSTGIYIIHPLFIMGLPLIFSMMRCERIFVVFGPLIVFIAALTSVWICSRSSPVVKKWIKDYVALSPHKLSQR